MSDFTYDFSAQATANPWTIPSTFIKLGATTWRILNGTGLKSTSVWNNIWGSHDVNYTGGSTEIIGGIKFPSLPSSTNYSAAAVFVRTGANAAAGYNAEIRSSTSIVVNIVSAAGARTYLTGVTVSALTAGTDIVSLGYKQSTNTLTVYVNGVSQGTTTDATYNAETTMAGGFMIYQESGTDDQAISYFEGTGVAAAQTLATITSPIVDGATSDSGTYSGFTGTPDTLTIETTGALYSTAMTSLSAAAGSFTFNVPGLPTVNTARTPYTTASWAIRAKLSVSAESATKTVTHNPPSGYSALEITGTWSLIDESSFAYGWNAAPGTTSQLVYPTANNLTVNASTGAFTTDQTTGTISYWLWDVGDATLKPFTWTLSSSASLFRTSSLTASTLTASAITAAALIA